MAQSDIQTLIQNLAGVQTQAQQGASNTANNGNPNTVYNQSAWGYGGPPAMNQAGEWSMNNLSRPPTIQLSGWKPPAGWGSVGNGTGPVLPINGGIVTDPNWVPGTFPGGGGTTTPPTTTPPTGTPGGGTAPVGGGGGGGSTGIYGPDLWAGGTTGGGGGGGSGPSGGNPFTNETGGLNLGGIGSAFTNLINTTRSNLGVGQEGFSMGQFLDAITEPFLPGDFYNGQLQNGLNKAEVTKGVLNMVVPGGGNLAAWLASKIPSDSTGFLGKIRDFFARGEISQAMDAIEKQKNIDTANGKDPRNNPYATGTSPLGNFDGNMINWSTVNSWNNKPTGTPTVTVGPVTNVGNSGGVGGVGGALGGLGITGQGGWGNAATGLGSAGIRDSVAGAAAGVQDTIRNTYGAGSGWGGNAGGRTSNAVGGNTIASGDAAIGMAEGLQRAANTALFNSISNRMYDSIKIK